VLEHFECNGFEVFDCLILVMKQVLEHVELVIFLVDDRLLNVEDIFLFLGYVNHSQPRSLVHHHLYVDELDQLQQPHQVSVGIVKE
jgi:hypothetical protein